MRKLAVLMVLMMIGLTCLYAAFAEADEIRVHTFAIPKMNRVNVRREPAGSIRGTVDKKDSVYILNTTLKRKITWCRVIVFKNGWQS